MTMPSLANVLMFGGAAGVAQGIGQQIWSDENQRRYVVLVVVFLILLWFIMLNK